MCVSLVLNAWATGESDWPANFRTVDFLSFVLVLLSVFCVFLSPSLAPQLGLFRYFRVCVR